MGIGATGRVSQQRTRSWSSASIPEALLCCGTRNPHAASGVQADPVRRGPWDDAKKRGRGVRTKPPRAEGKGEERRVRGGSPQGSLAHTLRLARPPSASRISKAVSLAPRVSATIRVPPSGVITIPFGKRRPAATFLAFPSGDR